MAHLSITLFCRASSFCMKYGRMQVCESVRMQACEYASMQTPEGLYLGDVHYSTWNQAGEDLAKQFEIWSHM